jgi:hypothetical protein
MKDLWLEKTDFMTLLEKWLYRLHILSSISSKAKAENQKPKRDILSPTLLFSLIVMFRFQNRILVFYLRMNWHYSIERLQDDWDYIFKESLTWLLKACNPQNFRKKLEIFRNEQSGRHTLYEIKINIWFKLLP